MMGVHLKTAYLLIHGLAGSRKELSYLFEKLRAQGLDASYVILKGHEQSNKVLSRTTYQEWISSAHESVAKAFETHEKVVLIGFSMGGLVASHLCNEFDIDKMIFVNTPIYFWDMKKISGNIVNDLKSRSFHHVKRYFTASTDKPFRTLLQFVMLLNKTKKLMTRIKCDALVLQSKKDDTVKASSADYIFASLNGKKQLKFYDGGSHQIFESEIKDQVCEDILSFL